MESKIECVKVKRVDDLRDVAKIDWPEVWNRFYDCVGRDNITVLDICSYQLGKNYSAIYFTYED